MYTLLLSLLLPRTRISVVKWLYYYSLLSIAENVYVWLAGPRCPVSVRALTKNLLTYLLTFTAYTFISTLTTTKRKYMLQTRFHIIWHIKEVLVCSKFQ